MPPPRDRLFTATGERGRLEGALECLQRAVPQLQPASFARLQASLDAPTEGLKTRHAAVDAAGRCDSCGEVLAAVDLTSDQVKGRGVTAVCNRRVTVV